MADQSGNGGLGDDCVLGLQEAAKQVGISVPTLRRLIAAEEGPRVTQLSQRRRGVRIRHVRQWLEARTLGENLTGDES
jgi:predicted DNA-binding transcriptional regulator AlpA